MSDIASSYTHYSEFYEENGFTVDTMPEMTDYNYTDIPDIEKYQALKNKRTILTDAESQELQTLAKKLETKLLSVELLNKMFQSVVYMQQFFKENTVDLLTEHKDEFVNYMSRLQTRGVYNPDATYYECNMVTHNNGDTTDVYLCIEDNDGAGISGFDPTNTNYWAKLSLKGDKGDKGDDGANLVYKGVYNPEATYPLNTLVYYNNGLYISKQDGNLGNIPTTEANDYWQFWQYYIPDGTVTTTKLSEDVVEKIENSNKLTDTTTGSQYILGVEDGNAFIQML